MLSSSDIKRDIIEGAMRSQMFRRMKANPPSITEGEQMEIGNHLESLTKHKGWPIVEEYMLKRMNLVNMALSDDLNDVQRGVAKGFIELMQWIQLCIKTKNEIQERERLKYEKTEDVPQDEKD